MSHGFEPEREPDRGIDLARLAHDLAELLADPVERVDTLNELTAALPPGCLELDAEPPEDGEAAEARAILDAVRSNGENALKGLQQVVERRQVHRSKSRSAPEAMTTGHVPQTGETAYRVWFGTNRRPGPDGPNGLATFTAEDDQRLHWGTCTVNVPVSHRIGSIGSPWWRRVLGGFDDRLTLNNVTWQNEARFLAGLKAEMARFVPSEPTAIVFIHGFNVTFTKAALAAAQIGCDLNVPGAMAFYSWPSRGQRRNYPPDEATIGASEPYLTTFLTRIATASGASRVHVIAHSMGNRGLAAAVTTIAAKASAASGKPFANLILAAPDIDARQFTNQASRFPLVTERTTLYASSKDLALRSSGWLHGYPRAGFTPPVTVVPGVETIEVSNVDLTWLGHGYFAGARAVLQDMHHLLLRGDPPSQRFGLRPVGNYWTILA